MQTEETATTVENFILAHPIQFEDRKITAINLDFMKLDAQAMCKAEEAYFAAGGRPGMSVTSTHFCLHCAASISDEPIEAILKLKGQDAMKVTLAIQSFLLGGD